MSISSHDEEHLQLRVDLCDVLAHELSGYYLQQTLSSSPKWLWNRIIAGDIVHTAIYPSFLMFTWDFDASGHSLDTVVSACFARNQKGCEK